MSTKVIDIKPYLEKRKIEKLSKERFTVVYPSLYLVFKNGKSVWLRNSLSTN